MSHSTDPTPDRRQQILQAAMICFAKRGFHQTSMHDISEEAGISVGLIYRYFASKEAVISAMTEAHKGDIGELMARARLAPTLLEALEIIFTAHCCENAPQIRSAFVVDLFAEAGRNTEVAKLVRGVIESLRDGVTDLIARDPDFQRTPHGLQPEEMSELIFAVARGMMMRDVLEHAEVSANERRERQLKVARQLWQLLFEHANANEPALA
jgi:AcrR family transcriptional regulator